MPKVYAAQARSFQLGADGGSGRPRRPTPGRAPTAYIPAHSSARSSALLARPIGTSGRRGRLVGARRTTLQAWRRRLLARRIRGTAARIFLGLLLPVAVIGLLLLLLSPLSRLLLLLLFRLLLLFPLLCLLPTLLVLLRLPRLLPLLVVALQPLLQLLLPLLLRLRRHDPHAEVRVGEQLVRPHGPRRDILVPERVGEERVRAPRVVLPVTEAIQLRVLLRVGVLLAVLLELVDVVVRHRRPAGDLRDAVHLAVPALQRDRGGAPVVLAALLLPQLPLLDRPVPRACLLQDLDERLARLLSALEELRGLELRLEEPVHAPGHIQAPRRESFKASVP
mmetsp:Transcript_90881/g.257418  ORF Transcript_90881/g.257418 Transcript_90881/m.257418 type:complete len:336 (+) Transcript_90881:96-1103(+)